MPIEVRELVIKATVEETKPANASAVSTSSNINSSEEIIKLCVERVLDIIKEKTER